MISSEPKKYSRYTLLNKYTFHLTPPVSVKKNYRQPEKVVAGWALAAKDATTAIPKDCGCI